MNEILYRNLVKLRKQSGMSSRDIAMYLHVTPACYSNYEHGRRQIPLDIVVKLAELYQITIDELVRAP